MVMALCFSHSDILALIDKEDAQADKGAVLVFLPGFGEIMQVQCRCDSFLCFDCLQSDINRCQLSFTTCSWQVGPSLSDNTG